MTQDEITMLRELHERKRLRVTTNAGLAATVDLRGDPDAVIPSLLRAAERGLTVERYEMLCGALYQTVSAIVHQNEHPTSDGNKHDADLLDVLSDPLSFSPEQTDEILDRVREYYWAKERPNCTATPDAAQPPHTDNVRQEKE